MMMISGGLFVFLLVWTLLNSGVTDAKCTKTPACLLPEDHFSRKYMCHKVTCEKGEVIAIFEAAAGLKHATKSLQDHDLVCMGETEAFIYNSLSCFWKPECRLMFPLGRMITSKGGGLRAFTNGYGQGAQFNYECYNKEPDFACIINTRCIKETEIHDATTNLSHTRSRIKTRRGIIRSHDRYPWKSSTKIFDVQLTKKIGSSKILQVGVHDLDIRDSDNITMITAVRTATLNSSGFTMNGRPAGDLTTVLTFNNTDKYVRFCLSVESVVHSRGFVICFNESKKSKKGGRRHPCRRVFKKAKISMIDPNSKTCLRNSNGTKAKRKCCCDAGDHDLCQGAIDLAKYRRTIEHPSPTYSPQKRAKSGPHCTVRAPSSLAHKID